MAGELDTVSAWLKPRSRWLVWPVLLLGFAASFGAGMALAPERTEYIESVRTEWRTREVVKWKTSKATDTRTVVTPVLLPIPDGGVLLASSTVTETREREQREGDKETRSSTSAQTETSRKVMQPDWRVGVLVGASLRDPLLPIAGPLVLGATVERRIIGPFSVGLWGTTQGGFGISGSGEF